MELEGTIKAILPIEKKSETFTKRDFVVETKDGQYSQEILIQTANAKTDLLDSLSEGDQVKVQFNLKGKGINGKNGLFYMNTLDAWRIEKK